jgi:hypothetical protein
MNEVKVVILNIITAVLGFLSPIQDFMTAIVILFILNFLFGLTADMVTGGEWSWRKAFRFIIHCLIFFVLAAAVFTCGHYMHNENGAVQCVSYICYVAFYIYGVNILRNTRHVLKEGTDMYKVVDILYYVLTLKVVDKIPFLSEYLKKKNNKDIFGQN